MRTGDRFVRERVVPCWCVGLDRPGSADVFSGISWRKFHLGRERKEVCRCVCASLLLLLPSLSLVVDC